MATILFLVFIGFICKTIKTAVRNRPRRKVKALAPTRNDGYFFDQATFDALTVKFLGEDLAAPKRSHSLAALEALQAQRDLINEQIRDIDEQLDYCPPAKLRNQYMNRKTTLLGKLATCESKISRLCYGA